MAFYRFEISSQLPAQKVIDRLQSLARKPRTFHEQLPWNVPKLWHPDKASFVGSVEDNHFSFVPNRYERMGLTRMPTSICINGRVDTSSQDTKVVVAIRPVLPALIFSLVWIGYGFLISLGVAFAISPMKALVPLAFFGLPCYWGYKSFVADAVDSRRILEQSLKD